MKIIYTTLIFLGLFVATLSAQEVSKQLNEAGAAYDAGNLQETRMALQQAIHELDMAIGNEILKALPSTLHNMPIDQEKDNVSSAGDLGLFISRRYAAPENDHYISIEIIGDSPMISGVNALLSLPVFVGDRNQKRVRLGSRRALLQKNEGQDGIHSWDVQVPMGSTLLTFSLRGDMDEKKVTDLAGSLPLDQIERLTR
ncbi:MAG: hypothetical protein EA361_15575 [Bacteroidetes bacterium]|nr:MAG: hypothetical protein EA361_15575 [Bacteroidota bacterium]